MLRTQMSEEDLNNSNPYNNWEKTQKKDLFFVVEEDPNNNNIYSKRTKIKDFSMGIFLILAEFLCSYLFSRFMLHMIGEDSMFAFSMSSGQMEAFFITMLLVLIFLISDIILIVLFSIKKRKYIVFGILILPGVFVAGVIFFVLFIMLIDG